MPAIDRELAGDQGGAQCVTILEQLQWIPAVFVGELPAAKIMEHDQVGPGQ